MYNYMFSNSINAGPPMQVVGIIKSFNAEKGYGFIDCGETKKMFGGKDVLLNKTDVELLHLEVGEAVRFGVRVKNGNPQAVIKSKSNDVQINAEDSLNQLGFFC
jgi:cold shock CspA family protein